MNKLPLARQTDIVVQELENEILVYDLKDNKAYCLNETSKKVWQLCNGENTIAEITNKLTKYFKKDVSKDIVYLAIEQIDKDGLLDEKSNNFAQHFKGLSRREVIKKVGFASMIALPIVSSIVAPQAVDAQSGAPACTGTCFRPGENICANSNSTYFATLYSSTDGSCTGTNLGISSGPCIGPRSFSNDSCVN